VSLAGIARSQDRLFGIAMTVAAESPHVRNGS
jgi:hypothetical protein